jgi:hypothetical protein
MSAPASTEVHVLLFELVRPYRGCIHVLYKQGFEYWQHQGLCSNSPYKCCMVGDDEGLCGNQCLHMASLDILFGWVQYVCNHIEHL